MKKYIIISLFFLLFSSVYPQNFNFSLVNSLRYGAGNQLVNEGLDVEKGKEYLENLSEFKIFKDNFTVGIRYQLDIPPEYGLEFRGIKKRFLEYNSENLVLVAGNQNLIFSRGLTLNLFEDRGLAYDSEIDGIRLSYQNKYLKTTLLGGEINFYEPLSILYLNRPYFETYNLKGINFEVKPIKQFDIGGSYLKTKVKGPLNSFLPDSIVENTTIENYELFAKMHLSFLDFYAGYSIKNTQIIDEDNSIGTGFYGALSHSGDGYGITLEYKDYRYDIVDPFTRLDVYRKTRMLSYQNPPTVHKEHSYSLLTRYPHIVDFNDEVGFQIDAFFTLFTAFNINLNYSLSSRHYIYELDKNTYTFTRKQLGSTILPSLKDERSPFYEIFGEIEYTFDDFTSFIKVGFNRRVSVNYEVMNPTKPIQNKKMTAVPILIQYTINEKYGIKFSTENQWVMEFPQEEYYYNQLLSIQVSYSPIISVGGRIEYTNNKYEPNNKKFWLLGELSYKMNNNNQIILSYGEERGGQVCSNGVCRQVLPFNGFRLSAVYYLN